MNTILKRTKSVIFSQQTSIISSTLILAGMMLLSRTSGFVRYRLLAGYFTKDELDIFLAAFRIPDLVFEILINGALSTTFIPYFIAFQKKGKEHLDTISSIINIVMLSLFACIALLYVSMPWLTSLIAPGFSPEIAARVIFFSRLLLVGQLPFLVAGNFLTGMSQARRSFLIPALAPILYNLGIIVGTALLYPNFHLGAPVIGVIVGSILFFAVQIPVLGIVNFRYRLVMKRSQDAWQFFKTALPRIMTIIVAQIDATVDLTLATYLGSGAYTVFYFAQHLQLLPISVIGMAFGQASLPYLTELFQEKKQEELKKVIVDSILNIFFLTIPIAAFFIIARVPIVRLFFGGKKFDWNATVDTAITMSFFAFSLPVHSIYYFITRCFYAVFDTRSPFYISIFGIGLNALLSTLFTLVLHLPVWSMGLSFSIAMNIHVLILLIFLHKKIGGFSLKTLAYEGCKISLVTGVSSLMSFFLLRFLDGLIFDTTRTLNVFLLLFIDAIFFLIVYSFLSWLLSVREMYMITHMILKAKEYQKKLLELYSGVES